MGNLAKTPKTGRDGTSEIQCARSATPRFAVSKVQDTWSNVTDSQARKFDYFSTRVNLHRIIHCKTVISYVGTKNWIRVGGILRGLLHGGRHGNTGRSEDCATGALDLAPQQEPLAVLLHFHHLEAIQVLDHFRPPTQFDDRPWPAEPPVPAAAP